MGRGADKVWMSYQEAQLAVKHRMFQGNNKVIHANSIQSLEASTYSYHLNNEKSIISFIAIRDKEKSLKTLNDLFKEILKNNATPVHVYEVCDDILTRILLYLKEIDADLPLQFEQQVLKNRESSLYEDIEQLKKWLYSVICSAIDMLNNSNNSNSNRIILEAQRFVINNYFNHISLNTIAEYLNISPQYFSELFKKETGENFIKYLTNVRMEKAKELLNEPGIKTYEVSELVSYDNPTYFNKVFKKIVGVSPQRYRNLQFKKE